MKNATNNQTRKKKKQDKKRIRQTTNHARLVNQVGSANTYKQKSAGNQDLNDLVSRMLPPNINRMVTTEFKNSGFLTLEIDNIKRDSIDPPAEISRIMLIPPITIISQRYRGQGRRSCRKHHRLIAQRLAAITLTPHRELLFGDGMLLSTYRRQRLPQ